MKHIKSYENITDNIIPQKGDFVIMSSFASSLNVKNFIENSIGKIVQINTMENDMYVLYENVPDNIRGSFPNNIRDFRISQIIHSAHSSQELEIKQNIHKYNL